MYDELVKQCRDCIDCLCGECKYEHLQKPGNFVPCMNALLKEAADAIEGLSELADAIPHVCECCVGCELEKKNGRCDHAFVLSPKRAIQYLIKSKWVPVTEANPFPPEPGHYITMTNATGRSKGVIDQEYVKTTKRGKEVERWECYGMISTWRVTHWMPLPEPPREE